MCKPNKWNATIQKKAVPILTHVITNTENLTVNIGKIEYHAHNTAKLKKSVE